MTVINFPAGAGGNWLISMLRSDPLPDGAISHWHDGANFNPGHSFILIHSLDNDYDILYSGSYCFNFYLNVLLKSHVIDKNFQSGYKNKFNQMFETATWLHDWSRIQGIKKADLTFDDLIVDHLAFYQKVLELQRGHNLPCVDLDQFGLRRTLFFETCVKSDTVFENFDDMTWVIYVLAWLQQTGCLPQDKTHFIMDDPDNQHLCKQFAWQNYDRCPKIINHIFTSGRPCPDFLQTVF